LLSNQQFDVSGPARPWVQETWTEAASNFETASFRAMARINRYIPIRRSLPLPATGRWEITNRHREGWPVVARSPELVAFVVKQAVPQLKVSTCLNPSLPVTLASLFLMRHRSGTSTI
jgi:hypothetical protein